MKRLVDYGLRSTIASAAVALGTMCLIVVTTVLAGLSELATDQFRGLNASSLLIVPSQRSLLSGRLPWPLTHGDADAIARGVRGITNARPLITVTGMVRACGERKVVPIVGVAEDARAVHAVSLSDGRLIQASDINDSRQVAVIGEQLADELQCLQRPEKAILVSNRSFEIIGRFDAPADAVVPLGPTAILIPYTTAERLYGDSERQSRLVVVQLERYASPEQVKLQVTSLLRARHRILPGQPEDFEIRSRDDLIAAAEQVTRAIRGALVGLVTISLITAGVGVFNALLTSVTERQAEIGLRRSVGASRKAIMRQFLAEALTIVGVGAIGGVVAGTVLSWPVVLLMGIRYRVDWSTIIFACLFSQAIGLVAGTWPAMRAARLQPVDALRHE